MICPTAAQGFYGNEIGLLTALVLGFFFGLALERAGFGNARKLAAQFYGYDMTVFKVMFTAVVVAMVGLYAAVAFGFMDLELLYINPTFLWGQVVGGFVVGVGFALGGLCPGTSVVALASGRLDGLVSVAGIFFGTFLFSLGMDWLPPLRALYTAGAQGRSLLPALVGLPAPWLTLIIVAVATVAFVGAEALEKKLAPRFKPVELTPTGGRRVKFALMGALAVVAIAAGLAPAPQPLPLAAPRLAAALEPAALADALIAGSAGAPGLTLLDLRDEAARAALAIPGAQAATLTAEPPAALAAAAAGSTVLLVTGGDEAPALPTAWPASLVYRTLRGGALAWQAEVLTPQAGVLGPGAERQRQLAAYFSGAEAAAPAAAAPPPAPSTSGGKVKKPGGGC
ncbi:hypothetical protein FJ251_13765 [bacterium]|nr:hypothetical protein [bacterium]